MRKQWLAVVNETELIVAHVGLKNHSLLKVFFLHSFKLEENFINDTLSTGNYHFEQIRDWFAVNKIPVNKLKLAVSSLGLITRVITLPVMSMHDLEKLVNNHINQYFTIDVENYVIDYKILNKFQEKKRWMCNILLAAFPRYKMENIWTLCKAIGFEPEVIDLTADCLSRLYAKVAVKSKTSGDMAVIALYDNKAEFVILDKGIFFLYSDLELDMKAIADSLQQKLEAEDPALSPPDQENPADQGISAKQEDLAYQGDPIDQDGLAHQEDLVYQGAREDQKDLVYLAVPEDQGDLADQEDPAYQGNAGDQGKLIILGEFADNAENSELPVEEWITGHLYTDDELDEILFRGDDLAELGYREDFKFLDPKMFEDLLAEENVFLDDILGRGLQKGKKAAAVDFGMLEEGETEALTQEFKQAAMEIELSSEDDEEFVLEDLFIPQEKIPELYYTEADLGKGANAKSELGKQTEAESDAERQPDAVSDVENKIDKESAAGIREEALSVLGNDEELKFDSERPEKAEFDPGKAEEPEANPERIEGPEFELLALEEIGIIEEQHVEADAEAEIKAIAKAEAAAKIESTSEAESEAKIEPKAEAESEAETETKAEAEAEAKIETIAEAEAIVESEAIAESKATAEAEVIGEVDVIAETEVMVKSETAVDAEAIAEPELAANAEAEVAVEPADGAEAAVDVEAISETEVSSENESTVEPEAIVATKAPVEAKATVEAEAAVAVAADEQLSAMQLEMVEKQDIFDPLEYIHSSPPPEESDLSALSADNPRLHLEKALNPLISTLAELLSFYGASHFGNSVSTIYLTGEYCNLPYLLEILEKNLGIDTVVGFPGSGPKIVTKNNRILTDWQKYGSLYGLALRED